MQYKDIIYRNKMGIKLTHLIQVITKFTSDTDLLHGGVARNLYKGVLNYTREARTQNS